MTLKTFNIDEKSYKEYSDYCKKEGISMSKRVEQFIRAELENLKSNKNNKSIKGIKPETIPSIAKDEHSMIKYC